MLTDTDCFLLRSLLTEGDARMLAVLQLAEADGDEDELTDSLTRIAHSHSSAGRRDNAVAEQGSTALISQTAGVQPTGSPSSQADGRETVDSTRADTDIAQQASSSAPQAAVTVEDVTRETDDSRDEDIATAPRAKQPDTEQQPTTPARTDNAGEANGAANETAGD